MEFSLERGAMGWGVVWTPGKMYFIILWGKHMTGKQMSCLKDQPKYLAFHAGASNGTRRKLGGSTAGHPLSYFILYISSCILSVWSRKVQRQAEGGKKPPCYFKTTIQPNPPPLSQLNRIYILFFTSVFKILLSDGLRVYLPLVPPLPSSEILGKWDSSEQPPPRETPTCTMPHLLYDCIIGLFYKPIKVFTFWKGD